MRSKEHRLVDVRSGDAGKQIQGRCPRAAQRHRPQQPDIGAAQRSSLHLAELHLPRRRGESAGSHPHRRRQRDDGPLPDGGDGVPSRSDRECSRGGCARMPADGLRGGAGADGEVGVAGVGGRQAVRANRQ